MRFGKLLLLTVGMSGLISCLVWGTLGKGFHKQLDYINLDFFNIIGVAFTIVGFAIAIFQIAELRNEQQIRNVISDLHEVISKQGYLTFPKQRINAKIEEVIEKIQACEAKLKA